MGRWSLQKILQKKFHILFEGLVRINLAPRARGQNRRQAASATGKHQPGRG